MQNSNIIAAISTAPGVGGIAIVRLSGNGCIQLVDKLFDSPSLKKLKDQRANTVHFGAIKKGNEILDEVLVTVFHAPHSFTGEESVEISCHGSIFIQQGILNLLIESGANLAQAGEFTQRAFLNGKMDLSQAESVADLIASTSASTHRLAMNQMRGGFSNKLMELRVDLLNFTSLIELELDFSEEDVEFANRGHLKDSASRIAALIDKLANSFSLGNAIKSGIPVAIVGETNAGKSTLLNLFLNEEKAIVSDIHGTTRDVIEDTVNLNGITFRFIDTAGIRDTQDTIESLGIERAYRKLEQASIVLWVVDIQSSDEHILSLSEQILSKSEGKQLILIFNKYETVSEQEKIRKDSLFKDSIANRVFISAKHEQNLEALENLLLSAANIPEISDQDVIVTNVRHYEALQKALSAIRRVLDGLDNNVSGDFLSQDIRECMHYLGEITGQISTDEILANIFSKFCIGK